MAGASEPHVDDAVEQEIDAERRRLHGVDYGYCQIDQRLATPVLLHLQHTITFTTFIVEIIYNCDGVCYKVWLFNNMTFSQLHGLLIVFSVCNTLFWDEA